jgi:hypothetical protein
MIALAAMQHMKMSDLEFSEAFGKAALSLSSAPPTAEIAASSPQRGRTI